MVFVSREVPIDQGSSAHDVSLADQAAIHSHRTAHLPQ